MYSQLHVLEIVRCLVVPNIVHGPVELVKRTFAFQSGINTIYLLVTCCIITDRTAVAKDWGRQQSMKSKIGNGWMRVRRKLSEADDMESMKCRNRYGKGRASTKYLQLAGSLTPPNPDCGRVAGNSGRVLRCIVVRGAFPDPSI